MAWTPTQYEAQFDALASGSVSLATQAEKILWFNDAQTRLLRLYPKRTALTWIAAATSVALPSDFVSLERMVLNEGTDYERFRVFGTSLYIDDVDGITSAGGMDLYYWATWPDMVVAGPVSSSLPKSLDYACLYFAMSRFYAKLASNRAYYKRYATMVGANSVQMADLQAESDRYYGMFLDARDDLTPLEPALFFAGP